MEALVKSRQQILDAKGGDLLAQATAVRIAAAHALAPAPRDPAGHLGAAHAQARHHLARLTGHDPAREVPAFMTNELFSRLTDARPAPLAVTRVGGYTYTPRKVLRRVLDHALDHLNQIEQWLAWQHRGVVPTPTDGWVPSTVTLPEDRLPLTSADVDAWLWRIDQAARLLAQRAAGLSRDELDWAPPDGGWPLRRVLHHVARSELMYAASFDEALPADPLARYAQADACLAERLASSRATGGDPQIVFPDPYGTFRTPGGVVQEVLALERELIALA